MAGYWLLVTGCWVLVVILTKLRLVITIDANLSMGRHSLNYNLQELNAITKDSFCCGIIHDFKSEQNPGNRRHPLVNYIMMLVRRPSDQNNITVMKKRSQVIGNA